MADVGIRSPIDVSELSVLGLLEGLKIYRRVVELADLAALAGALDPRKAAFDADGAYVPASTMVQITALFLPGAMIEVEMIAHLEG